MSDRAWNTLAEIRRVRLERAVEEFRTLGGAAAWLRRATDG